jgi:hypothetical protein
MGGGEDEGGANYKDVTCSFSMILTSFSSGADEHYGLFSENSK